MDSRLLDNEGKKKKKEMGVNKGKRKKDWKKKAEEEMNSLQLYTVQHGR